SHLKSMSATISQNSRKRKADDCDPYEKYTLFRHCNGQHYNCTTCSFATDDSPEFYNHMTSVHDTVPFGYPRFGCPIDGCAFAASTLEPFVDHRNRSHHEVKNGYWGVTSRLNMPDSLQCPCCSTALFRNAFLFQAHTIACHGRDYKWSFKFSCEQCSRHFPSSLRLIEHFKDELLCMGNCVLTYERRVKIESMTSNPAAVPFANKLSVRYEDDIDME
ncbi:hypothetical protein PENTCL1PPCAC_28887, partial [Pristionchus entomophagus]